MPWISLPNGAPTYLPGSKLPDYLLLELNFGGNEVRSALIRQRLGRLSNCLGECKKIHAVPEVSSLADILAFSSAKILAAPWSERDGGSVYLDVDIEGEFYRFRYAGAIGDILDVREGMIEIRQHRGFEPGEFIHIADLNGWVDFIERNRVEIGDDYADILLGKRPLSEKWRNDVLTTFRQG